LLLKAFLVKKVKIRRDGLPSLHELVLLRQAQDKFAIRRRTSSHPLLAVNRESENKKLHFLISPIIDI